VDADRWDRPEAESVDLVGPRRRPLRSGALVALVLVVASAVACGSDGTASAPTTPWSNVAGSSPVLVDDASAEDGDGLGEGASEPVELSYGPDPRHTMDVHRSVGDSKGTIVYVHGGAWVGGSKDDVGSPGFGVVVAQTHHGWDVVSIGYRLATQAAGPGTRAPDLLADVDRAVRVVRRDADQLGLDLSTLVISGGSAGGHLALMHTLGAPSDEFVDPDLPQSLGAVPATVDAVVAVVAPTDLHTEWMSGGVAPGGQESLLGCTLADEAAIAGMGPCDVQVVDRFSPLWWATGAGPDGRPLPPVYFAYGGADTLVPMETQGTPIIETWAATADPGRTWVDLPPEGGHDLDRSMNRDALTEWLDHVDSGRWALPD
jgi:acetyl esterase/lipase